MDWKSYGGRQPRIASSLIDHMVRGRRASKEGGGLGSSEFPRPGLSCERCSTLSEGLLPGRLTVFYEETSAFVGITARSDHLLPKRTVSKVGVKKKRRSAPFALVFPVADTWVWSAGIESEACRGNSDLFDL